MEQPTKRWNPIELFFILILIGVGFYLRFYNLSERPLHHDESLHGMYSLYYFENPISQYYKYDPLLHGPFLYHIIPWFFWALGVTKFALRLPAVMIGSFLMLVPLFLKNWLSKGTIIILVALISLSPTLTYWSRFIRHDSFILLGLLFMFLAFYMRWPILKALLIGLGAGIQFSTKENSFIHTFFLLVFIFYEQIIDHFFNFQQKTLLSRLINFIIENPFATFLGLSTFVGIYLHYYTAGFVYWDGALDGLYRKSLVYWFEQHQKERISGPFSFAFLINVFFEAWWLPALLIHLLAFYKRQTWIIRVGFIFSLVFGALTHFTSDDPGTRQFISQYLKLKIPLDYYLFFPILFHGVVAPTTYLLEKRQAKAISAFLFFASLFTYSYLGEKVPWLAIYPLVTGLAFFAFEFDRTFHWPIAPVIIIVIVHMAYTTYWSNHKFPGAKVNLLSQVHTTQEFEETLVEIRSQMESNSQGKGPYFLIKNAGAWPTTWYLHGRREYHHLMGHRKLEEYDYILGEPSDHELRVKLKGHFNREIIGFRGWWLPDYKKMSLKGLWDYFYYKRPWNETGEQELGLWIKKPKDTTESLSD